MDLVAFVMHYMIPVINITKLKSEHDLLLLVGFLENEMSKLTPCIVFLAMSVDNQYCRK